MKTLTNQLIISQLDQKMADLQQLRTFVPPTGWIRLIRKTLGITLRQVGDKLSKGPQSISDIEKREVEGKITLNTLKDIAGAMNMTLVYGFIPNDGSLEKLVDRKAREMAEKIVHRTSVTMKLEDQENSKRRVKQAIEVLAEELKREMPNSLWD